MATATTASPPPIEVDPQLADALAAAHKELEEATARIESGRSAWRNMSAVMAPLAGKIRLADENRWRETVDRHAKSVDIGKAPADPAAADREKLANLDSAFRWLADWELPRRYRHATGCQITVLRTQADVLTGVATNRTGHLAGMLAGPAAFEGGLSVDLKSLRTQQIATLADKLRAAAQELEVRNHAASAAADQGRPRSGTFDDALPFQVEFSRVFFEEVKE